MSNHKIRTAIEYLRPNAQFDLDGDTLTGLKWTDLKQKRPSDAEITDAMPAALLAAARVRKIAEAKAEAKRRILSRWPEEKQRNVLLGLLTQADVDACKSWIAAHITASNNIEADIQASADPANFDVIGSLRWPA